MDMQQRFLCIVAIYISLRITWNAYLHVKFPIFFFSILTKFEFIDKL